MPNAPSSAPDNSNNISEKQTDEILQKVDEALAHNSEHDPKHEALKLAMSTFLDEKLKDANIVRKVLEKAETNQSSPNVLIAISKRLATLLGDHAYYDQLTSVENHYLHEKSKIAQTDHEKLQALQKNINAKVRSTLDMKNPN